MIQGRLADRRIAAERLLAITFTIGSVLLFLVADYEGQNTTFLFWFFIFIICFILFLVII